MHDSLKTLISFATMSGNFEYCERNALQLLNLQKIDSPIILGSFWGQSGSFWDHFWIILEQTLDYLESLCDHFDVNLGLF